MDRIRYLRAATRDLVWYRTYYEDVFPEGQAQAYYHYLKSLRLIQSYPEMGKPAGRKPRRRFSIPRTPFVIVYQFRNSVLEIVRVWDTRNNDEPKWT